MQMGRSEPVKGCFVVRKAALPVVTYHVPDKGLVCVRFREYDEGNTLELAREYTLVPEKFGGNKPPVADIQISRHQHYLRQRSPRSLRR
jgi:hypothetical protein